MQTKYTTMADVTAKITGITISNDDLDNVISIVSGYVDTYLGYRLACDHSEVAGDYYLDGSGTEFLILPQPLNGSIRVENVGISGNPAEEIYIAKYPLNASHVTYLAKKNGKFYPGFGNYVIKNARQGVFVVDFTTPANHTLDKNVQEAVTVLCAEMIKKAGASILAEDASHLEYSGPITSETIGSYSASYANDTTKQKEFISSVPTAGNILNKYKRVSIV